jgi:hypothetical protein
MGPNLPLMQKRLQIQLPIRDVNKFLVSLHTDILILKLLCFSCLRERYISGPVFPSLHKNWVVARSSSDDIDKWTDVEVAHLAQPPLRPPPPSISGLLAQLHTRNIHFGHILLRCCVIGSFICRKSRQFSPLPLFLHLKHECRWVY